MNKWANDSETYTGRIFYIYYRLDIFQLKLENWAMKVIVEMLEKDCFLRVILRSAEGTASNPTQLREKFLTLSIAVFYQDMRITVNFKQNYISKDHINNDRFSTLSIPKTAVSWKSKLLLLCFLAEFFFLPLWLGQYTVIRKQVTPTSFSKKI